MNTHFVVQRVQELTLWAGENRWTYAPIGARWFDTREDADLAAVRELPDPGPEWRVIEIHTGQAA